MVGLAAGVGYIVKKMLKENFLGDPSTSVMNYGKWTAILAGSMALKTYLEDQKILPKQLQKIPVTTKMASIAIMLGGAVLNATTFICGSYLAKYLSGGNTNQERARHDKALEKYQKGYSKYEENRQQLLDWVDANRHNDAIASQNLSNTDEALKLYNRTHPNENLEVNEHIFPDYYRPSNDQKIGEILYVGGGMLSLGYLASEWLQLSNLKINYIISKMSTEENPFDTGIDNPGMDETGEHMEIRNLNPYDSSSRRGSVDPTGHHRTHGEASFGGDISDTTPLIQRENKRDDAWARIKRKFPNFNPTNSSFTANIDNYDQVIVKLKRLGGRSLPLFKADIEINEKLPKTIKESLGPPADKIVETNEGEILRRQDKIAELLIQLQKTRDEDLREGLNQTIAEEFDAIAQLETENKKIEQRMVLRDRVKAIFKNIWIHCICCGICCRRGHWRYRG